MKKFKISVFIFRRDLRLNDNTALINALENSELVIPIFIFNKKQISEQNEYRSLNAMQFIKNSILNLNAELKKYNSKIFMFYDKIDNILLKLKQELNIEAIYINEDYTPFARKRDEQIKEFCNKEKIEFFSFEDALLNHPKNTVKENKFPYTIFTPYYRKNSLLSVKIPIKNSYDNYFNKKINFALNDFPKEFELCNNSKLKITGEKEELNQLISNLKTLQNYQLERDFPILEKTSYLSTYLRFGILSVREIYYLIKENLTENHPLIRQLYWRDFFYSIGYFYPSVIGSSFHKKYDKIVWSENKELLKAWQDGKTGFPIVDAGMRELNETGYMHNRVRMIVASFLIKDLHINWQSGEKYFAQKLVDIDILINNGNWQWAASTGCDAQPYFRIFNPWSQQIKFDENCEYIKKWVPELKKLTSKQIHNLYKLDYNLIGLENYPKQIITHEIESKIAKEIYSKC